MTEELGLDVLLNLSQRLLHQVGVDLPVIANILYFAKHISIVFFFPFLQLIWILAKSKDKDPFSNILSLDCALGEFTPLFLFLFPG